MKKALTLLCSGILSASLLTGCGGSSGGSSSDSGPRLSDSQKEAALLAYAEWAFAAYSESLVKAEALQTTITALTTGGAPTSGELDAAKTAYEDARIPYQQTEALRFDESFVDAGLNDSVDAREGQINAWPLDEGLIDYTAAFNTIPGTNIYSYDNTGNIEGAADIIGNAGTVCGEDTTTIDGAKLIALNDACGGISESNALTGFHAIEFLLWGQDTNHTSAGAGTRSETDFDTGAGCTNGNCDRRVAFIDAAAQQLVDDLTDLKDLWDTSGALRDDLINGDMDNSLHRVLFGWGSLALGELASERMKVALDANSPEDEHDCFSDLTHLSLFNNAQSLVNVYYGSYTPVGGSPVDGVGIDELVASIDSNLDSQIQLQLTAVMSEMQDIVDLADGGEAFDQQISATSSSTAITEAVAALVALTDLIEEAADTAFGISNLAADGGSNF